MSTHFLSKTFFIAVLYFLRAFITVYITNQHLLILLLKKNTHKNKKSVMCFLSFPFLSFNGRFCSAVAQQTLIKCLANA